MRKASVTMIGHKENVTKGFRDLISEADFKGNKKT